MLRTAQVFSPLTQFRNSATHNGFAFTPQFNKIKISCPEVPLPGDCRFCHSQLTITAVNQSPRTLNCALILSGQHVLRWGLCRLMLPGEGLAQEGKEAFHPAPSHSQVPHYVTSGRRIETAQLFVLNKEPGETELGRKE